MNGFVGSGVIGDEVFGGRSVVSRKRVCMVRGLWSQVERGMGRFKPVTLRPARDAASRTAAGSMRASASSAASSSKKAYYAVRAGAGGYQGIVRTWDECSALVSGVSGAKYKKFLNRDDALAFVEGKPIPSAVSAPNARATASERSAQASRKLPRQSQTAARVVYTDGACSANGQNGAYGGYGVFFGDGDRRNVSRPLQLSEPQTNNRAELHALLTAIQILLDEADTMCRDNPDTKAPSVILKTDSTYCMKGIGEWIHKWKQTGWKTANGQDVKNRELWEAFDRSLAQLREKCEWVEIEWVRAHQQNSEHGNVQADILAVQGAAQSPLYSK